MRKLIALALLLIAACKDHRPPTPDAEQNQQLNDADRMLNQLNDNSPESNHKSGGATR